MTSTTAIIAEGGGQRGIYSAGVLDAFMAGSFNPFDLAVGVSAGAQNLLAYTLEQPGYARRAIEELTSLPGFFKMHRCLMGRSVLDLDGYFETILHDPDFLLPCNDLATVRRQRCLHVVATDINSLDAVYLKPGPSTALLYLKASSAVPLLYRAGVPVNGQMLVDGGVADPLPVCHAYAQGARRIVLVRNEPFLVSGQVNTSGSRLLNRTRRLPIKSTLFLRMLERHEQAMQSVRDFIHNPPADLQLHVIAPRVALKSKVFSSPAEHLKEDYELGFADGLRSAKQLAAWSMSPAREICDEEY